MNKRRLLKLADLLEKDAKNKKGIKFDMCGWGTVQDRSAPLSCGTEACAMGLAALSGAFKRAGLSAKIEAGFVTVLWHGEELPGGGFGAAEQLFGISYRESEALFAPRNSRDSGARRELAKANQIRRFVETGQLYAR